MAKERSHYPAAVYVLTVVCALGLVSVALGIAEGWILIGAGVTAIAVSLLRLHRILDRRRVAAAPRRRSLDGRPPPDR